MVTIDEEGGRVSRAGGLIAYAPSARDVAATMTVDQAYQQALERGRQLRALGVTVNFAPDVDVSSQPADSVIGDRSYSDDPDVVTAYAGAYHPRLPGRRARCRHEALSRPRLRLGRLAHRRGDHPAVGAAADLRPGAVPQPHRLRCGGDGRAPRRSRAHRTRRARERQPRGDDASAHRRRLRRRALQRPDLHRRPRWHGGDHRPLQHPRCGGGRAGSRARTWRCGSPRRRSRRCSTTSSRRWRRVGCPSSRWINPCCGWRATRAR